METCRSRLRSDESVTPSKRTWPQAVMVSEPSCNTRRQQPCWETVSIAIPSCSSFILIGISVRKQINRHTQGYTWSIYGSWSQRIKDKGAFHRSSPWAHPKAGASLCLLGLCNSRWITLLLFAMCHHQNVHPCLFSSICSYCAYHVWMVSVRWPGWVDAQMVYPPADGFLSQYCV